jgi:hypothetical protein
MNMGRIGAAIVFFLLGTTSVFGQAPAKTGQEPPKLKVAIVRFERLLNNETINIPMVPIVTAERDTVESLRKVREDIRKLQLDIVAASNETQLSEMIRKLEFLSRKERLLRSRAVGEPNRDMKKVLQEFVIENFKDKYPLILQDPYALDRVVFKRVEVYDITDDVIAKVKEAIAKNSGEN